jgi:hypothetical protein
MVRVFGLGETVDGTESEAAAVEQILGLAPNGRRNSISGTEPWLTGPAGDLFGAASIVGIPHLTDAIATATEQELSAARHTVIALFRYLPLMTRMVDVMCGDDNHIGLAGLSQFTQQPECIIYLIPLVVAMLRAGWTENLNAVATALQQFPGLAQQAERILGMPTATINANLAEQPHEIRRQAQRLIEAALDGEFGSVGWSPPPGTP